MPPKKDKKAAFQPKEMVLAKMTGFPAWPSFVMPSEMIPSAILRAKKKTTNLCVIFIPDGDFNWMNEKSLELLSQEKLDAKLSKLPKEKLKIKPKKKSGRTNNVAEALVSANGLDFNEFMEDLALQNKGFAAGENEQEDDADQEDDPIEEDGDSLVVDEKKDPDPEPIVEEQKEIDSPKSEPNNVASTLEEDIEDEDEDAVRPRKRTRSGQANGTSKKRAVSAPANGETKNGHGKNAPKGEARSSSPKPMSEKDRQHQLWLCRIKLQRSLIQRNQPVTPKDPAQFPAPTVDELLVARIILHRLADFPVSVELLRETKIHKVLKCIIKDEDLEYPDSFRLHEKCEELLDKWKDKIEGLKVEKQARLESRLSSQAPEDSEISGIETKKTLEGDHVEKVKV